MGYIDFGSITGGMTETAKAIGAISDLGTKLKYGEREAEADIKLKETNAERAVLSQKAEELAYQQAQEKEQQDKFTTKMKQQSMLNDRMFREINESNKFNIPVSKESLDNALKYISSNQTLTSNVKSFLDTGDATAINSFRDLSKRAYEAGSKFMADGKIDNDELQQVKGLYIELAKYKDPKLNLTTNDITMDDTGIWKVDQNGNKVQQIESMSPMQMVMNMSLQDKALGSLVKAYSDKSNVENYSKFTKEHRDYIDATQSMNNILDFLPSNTANVIRASYQGATAKELQDSLPKLREQALAHTTSKDLETMKSSILSQAVVSSYDGTPYDSGVKTYGEWFSKHGTKNPEVAYQSAVNMVDNWLKDPKNVAFASERGYTRDQLISSITTPQFDLIKKLGETTKASLEGDLAKSSIELHKAETAYKYAQAAELGRKGDSNSNSLATFGIKEQYKANLKLITKLTDELNDPATPKSRKASIANKIKDLKEENNGLLIGRNPQPQSTIGYNSQVSGFTVGGSGSSKSTSKGQTAVGAVKESKDAARAKLTANDYRYKFPSSFEGDVYKYGGLGNGIGSSLKAIGGAVAGKLANTVSTDMYTPRDVSEQYLSPKELTRKVNESLIRQGYDLSKLQVDKSYDPLDY